MIYLRNNNSIIGTIVADTMYKLNPLYWKYNLDSFGRLLFSKEPLETPQFIPVSEVYGFSAPPKDYYFVRSLYQKVICLYVDGATKVIKYRREQDLRDKTNGEIWYINNRREAGYVFLNLSEYYHIYAIDNNDGKGVRTYQELPNYCENTPTKGGLMTVLFWDKYGIPQSVDLPVGEYSTSAEMDEDFRSVNYGLTYYSSVIPGTAFSLGEEAIKTNLRNFYDGLCYNNAVLVRKEVDGATDFVDGSLTEASLTTNYYGRNFAFSGILNLKCYEDYDSIIF